MKLEKRFYKTAMNNIVEYNDYLDTVIHLFKNKCTKEKEQKEIIQTLWYKVGNAILNDSIAIWLNDKETDLLEYATEYVEENLQVELTEIIKRELEVKIKC